LLQLTGDFFFVCALAAPAATERPVVAPPVAAAEALPMAAAAVAAAPFPCWRCSPLLELLLGGLGQRRRRRTFNNDTNIFYQCSLSLLRNVCIIILRTTCKIFSGECI
jgi:hypothetical protein